MKYEEFSPFHKKAIKNYKTFILRRIWKNEAGVWGTLIDYKKDQPFAVTLENDYYAIPAGMYELQKYSSKKFKKTYEVTGVPGRTKIIIHKGNIEAHTKGCILIGEQFEDDSILYSSHGFIEFMNRMNDTEKGILIVEDWDWVM